MSESEPRKDKSLRFGLLPFRSPLLRKSLSLSSPLLTEMFHFSRCCFKLLFIHNLIHTLSHMWVSPFGYLRIKACLRLPEAFRSLPRPSSPCVAKASSCCPSLVIYITLPFLKLGYFCLVSISLFKINILSHIIVFPLLLQKYFLL